MNIILFIYYNGHFILLLLIVLKVAHSFNHLKSISYLLRTFFNPYENVQWKGGKLSGSAFEIVENLLLYCLNGGVILWVSIVAIIKVLILVFYLHHYS